MFLIILKISWERKEKGKWEKKATYVRSGIRTHAYKSRLRPERSALDRSAILTTTFTKAKENG